MSENDKPLDTDPFTEMSELIQSLINELRTANAEKEILRAALQEIHELTPASGTIHKTAGWALKAAADLRRGMEKNQPEVNPAGLFGKPVMYVEWMGVEKR